MILKVLKQALRKHKLINKIENEFLRMEFSQKVKELQRRNSKTMLHAYYIPKAIELTLKEQNFLQSQKGVKQRAIAMLKADYENGVLDALFSPTKEGY